MTIEDLFPEAYYIDKVRESHEERLKSKGRTAEEVELTGTGPILPRLKQRFDELGLHFNKGSVAKRIRRDLIQCSRIADLPDGMEARAEPLLRSLHAALGTAEDVTR